MHRNQHVLVVDDDPAIRRLLEARLSTDGVCVLSVGSGEEAERVLSERACEIDLILLDVMMPDADGFTLCCSWRERPELAEIPVIFLTGCDSTEDTLRGFEHGGTDYIAKPFHQAILHARVNAALRTQRLIRERRQAEATVRDSEQRYRLLTDHCFDMISRHDSEGRYIDVSPSCKQMLGYRPDELIGKRCSDLIHPDDLSIVAANARSLMNLEPPMPVIYRGRCKDGSYVWLESISRLVPESNDEVHCVTRDVTSRKHVIDALLANEAKLHAITTQLPAIVWTTDMHLNVNSMYGSILAEFEIDGAIMIDRPLHEAIGYLAEGETKSIVDAHRTALRGESIHARFSHDQREFEVRVEPLLGSVGECIGCLGIAFDVTERRRIEEAERSRAALEHAVDAMEQVLGVIGHELRTPLTGLRVMSEFLLNDLDETGEHNQFLQMIHNEAIRMAGMVNNLLEAARLNSGKAQWNWSTFDIGEVCHNAIDIVHHAADHTTQVTFGCEIRSSDGDHNKPLHIAGDRDAIHRLFVNLVSNAERHTSEGIIDVKVDEAHRGDGRWIDITIRDSGEGIPQHILDKLGVPFALNAGTIDDGGNDGPTRGHGCGLGLAICKGIVTAHGGSIRFESHLGMGTTVHVSIRADMTGPADIHEHALFVNEVSQ